VIVSLLGYLYAAALAVLAFPLALGAQPKIAPKADIDLHTHAEWRVDVPVEFDTAGRLLFLFRDKFRLNPKGNWHLIRLTGPFSDEVSREEIDFSIPQEPADPESARRWDAFSSRLLLSPDGSHAYAIFQGAVVKAKPGPPPPGAVRNVSVESFSSLISFDLREFRVLDSAGVNEHSKDLVGEQISATGDLLLLYLTDTDWAIAIRDRFLHEVKTLTVSAIPVERAGRYSCQLRPDLHVECPTRAGGEIVLGPKSALQLAESTCKMIGSGAFGIGKDETIKSYVIQADRLCTRDESSNEELVSTDLLPPCRQGWRVSAISPDRHSVLTSCILMDTFLDTFSYISKASLQLIDVRTLVARTTIPLSTRHRSTFAVFHQSGTSTVAVIEDGAKLLLYTVAD